MISIQRVVFGRIEFFEGTDKNTVTLEKIRMTHQSKVEGSK